MSSEIGVVCHKAIVNAPGASRGATGSWGLNGGRRRSPVLHSIKPAWLQLMSFAQNHEGAASRYLID